jgi:hypothetical protein
MTRLVRKAMYLTVCGLLAAGAAMAHVPDPANSECTNPGPASLGSICTDKAIVYVTGNSGGLADPVGSFCVTVRDFNNVPIENSSVVVDFANCDVVLCSNQLDPDVITDCVSHTVRKLTDVNGVACFKVQGKSKNAGTLGCGGAAKDCVKIFADGVLLCSGDAPTFDLVSQGGEDGLNPNDLSEFVQQWLICGTDNLRCNYECSNQVLDPNDLSYFIEVWLVRGGSTSNCAGAGEKCP